MEFRFKQFTVRHARAAHKVGTDGVLLGAWMYRDPDPKKILDSGTGTGLIALMLAQRFPNAQLTGIDIDRESVEEAGENVAESPWSDRIEILEEDIREHQGTYDTIVSNPPYFIDSLHAPNERRSRARHTSTLSFEDQFAAYGRCLTKLGDVHIIIPYDHLDKVRLIAVDHGFFIHRQVRVKNSPQAKPKRALLTFRRDRIPPSTEEEIVIRNEDGSYAEQYRKLTSDFYLDHVVR